MTAGLKGSLLSKCSSVNAHIQYRKLAGEWLLLQFISTSGHLGSLDFSVVELVIINLKRLTHPRYSVSQVNQIIRSCRRNLTNVTIRGNIKGFVMSSFWSFLNRDVSRITSLSGKQQKFAWRCWRWTWKYNSFSSFSFLNTVPALRGRLSLLLFALQGKSDLQNFSNEQIYCS